MWLCLLLWYALVYAECARTAAQPSKFKPLPLTTDKLSKANRESENETSVTGLSNGETNYFHNKLHKSLPIVIPDDVDSKSRIGYERDLMLVLPVKPNGSETDLQMWYTQKPITAIVDDQGFSKAEHRADYDVYEDIKTEDQRHPYTNFLVNRASAKPLKSPLDYGYPESFKFVEDLNGLPSNHKPVWASTDVTDLTTSSMGTSPSTSLATEMVSSTRHNPFEMFESVKPLEINKFLSPSMLAIQESEESNEKKNVTESHIHTVPKRPSKRPTKKPQKPKFTTESPTTEVTQPEASSSGYGTNAMDSEQVYTAVRYTTLLKQTNDEFLPSHSHTSKPSSVSSVHYQAIPTTTSTTTTTTEAITSPRTILTTTTRQSTTTFYTTSTPITSTTSYTTKPTMSTTTTFPSTTRPTPSTTTWFPSTTKLTTSSTTMIPSTGRPTTSTATPTPSTSPTTTSSIPSSINDIAVYNVTEDVEDDAPLLDPIDYASQNLSDFQFQVDHFEPPKDVNFFKPDGQFGETEPFKDINPNISGDMLTNDMKNMLVSLGILKSDQISTTSTTERVIVRKEPVTPNIDPNSYTSFKKIPIDRKQPDKTGISDDMKDLLASFGLLPKKQPENETSGSRISRQQNLTQVNLTDSEIHLSSFLNFTNSVKNGNNLSPVFKLNSSAVGADGEADLTDFFNEDESATKTNNPVTDLDKSMPLNSDMFADDMKDTLENLGFLKQSSLSNRSSKSAHVFQPTTQLEKLNQDDAAKKITDVLKTIKSLSVKTETNNITADELEKQLHSITTTLESDSFNDVNDTLLLDILTSDSNLRLIESIDNMTNKFRPANKTWVVPNGETTTKLTTISRTPATEKVTQTTSSDGIKHQLEMKPPNPLSTEELLQLYEMGKNEIKRQQPNQTSDIAETPTTIPSSIDDTSMPGANTEIFNSNTDQPNVLETSSTSTSTSPSTSSETMTDTKASANNNAPIADLADSFGAGGVASEEPSADDLPTPKPNGLYFYLDWNSFLNVGEEDKRPIRIRFAPRAGNPRNFIPITVP